MTDRGHNDTPTKRNRARCRRCGDVVESRSRHDLVTCQCGAIAVDGGQDYERRIGEPEDFEEIDDALPDRP